MKILAFKNSNLVFNLLLKTFKRLDHQVEEVNPETFEFSDLQSKIEKFNPSFCLAQNYYPFYPESKNGSALERFLLTKNIPTACWYVDNPDSSASFQTLLRFTEPPFPDGFYFFYCDKDHHAFFEKRGLKASHLQSAVDEDLIHYEPTPAEQKAFETPLSFIASLEIITENSLYEKKEVQDFFAHSFYHEVLNWFDSPEIFTEVEKSGFTKESFRKYCADNILFAFDNFFSALYSSKEDYVRAKERFLQSISKGLPQDLAFITVVVSARADLIYSIFQMVSYVQRLEEKGLKVYGGKAWGKVLRHQNSDFRFLQPHDLYAAYASSKINFCYTKWQFLNSVVERPLFTLAAGGFPLTDYRSELDDMFEPGEIISYRSIDEAENLVEHYLQSEDDRKRIIEKGRKKVFERHTFRHRALQIIENLKQHYGKLA